ncbi:unnamed protein product [Paramecium octaurelia]|uniref:Uncharacterized protein n=1 Tax=Paramecium octaurelia TaxID=43137 RepID=A0A8S1WJM1_PAROT|nr:unnamed protein product [Paramecium octaurelia]
MIFISKSFPFQVFFQNKLIFIYNFIIVLNLSHKHRIQQFLLFYKLELLNIQVVIDSEAVIHYIINILWVINKDRNLETLWLEQKNQFTLLEMLKHIPSYHKIRVSRKRLSIFNRRKEKTRWQTDSGKNIITHYGKNVFYKDTVLIKTFLVEKLMIGQFMFTFDQVFQQICLDLYIIRIVFWQVLATKLKFEQYQPLNQLMILRKNKKQSLENQLKKYYKHGAEKSRILFYNWEGREELILTRRICLNSLNIRNADVIIMSMLNIKSCFGSQDCIELKINSLSRNGIQKGTKLQSSASTGTSLRLVNAKHPAIVLTPSQVVIL